MTLIDFGDFKLRFDPKEVRISIDGEIIDVGARREEEKTIPSRSLIADHVDIGDGTYVMADPSGKLVRKNWLFKNHQSNQK